MARVIAKGDLHGRADWKLPFYNEEWDEFVFVGDYFDSYELSAAEQLYNFNEIIRAKIAAEQQGKRVTLLMGNHDHHYIPGCTGHTTGYQAVFATDIREALTKNIDHIQCARLIGDHLFTHAGVTHTFLKLPYIDINHRKPDFAYRLNELLKVRPMSFMFNGTDPYGDDMCQGPLWVRPRALGSNMIPYHQVVGHTSRNTIEIREHYGYKLYLIDAPDYLVLNL